MNKISHTQIQTYLDCQRKWYLRYKLGLKLDNIHTQFGSFAHEVLDTGQIPPENVHHEFKEFFGIDDWGIYFRSIMDDLDAILKDYILVDTEIEVEEDYLIGKIDAVYKNRYNDKYLILDYKFSNYKRTEKDLLIDQQPYIYAVLYSIKENIPIENIEVGFLSIPKSGLNSPRVLSNGKLSKDKSQKTTAKMYRDKIKELNLNEEDYLDILEELEQRKVVDLVKTTVNIDMMNDIFKNIENVHNEINNKTYYLEKSSSFDCGRCDLYEECKVKRLGV